MPILSSALPTENARIGALNDEGRAQLGGAALLIQNAVGDSDDDKDISETGVGDEDLGPSGPSSHSSSLAMAC